MTECVTLSKLACDPAGGFTFDELSEKEKDMSCGIRTIKRLGSAVHIEFLASLEEAGYPDDFTDVLRRYFSAGDFKTR